MTTQTLYAVVDSSGKQISGTAGITSQRTSTGVYSISFGTTFKTLPALVAAQCNNAGLNTDLNTTLAAVAVLTTESAIIYTGQSNHNVKLDAGFSLIVYGEI